MFKSDIMVHRFLGYFDTVNHQPVINETNQPSRHGRPSRPPSSIARLYFAGHLIVEEVALLTPSFSALKSLDVYNVYIYICMYVYTYSILSNIIHWQLSILIVRFSFFEFLVLSGKVPENQQIRFWLQQLCPMSSHLPYPKGKNSSKRSILPQVWSFDRFLPL